MISDAPPDVEPGPILAALTADAKSLDAVGKTLGEKLKLLAKVELSYQDAYDEALLESDESSKEKREAAARQKVSLELRGELGRLRREIEAYKEWVRIKGSVMSARQSQLASLREEMRAG